MDQEFQVADCLNHALLLERFLADCQALTDEAPGDTYAFTYVADTVAAIYYYREYDSVDEFIEINEEFLDLERTEWVRYMWRTLDTMSDEQRANIIIESISQLPVVIDC